MTIDFQLIDFAMASLHRHRDVVVSPYHWPDLDGLASACVLAQVVSDSDTTAHVLVAEEPQLDAQWALNRYSITPATSGAIGRATAKIVVDTSAATDVPAVARGIPTQLCVDHHFDRSGPLDAAVHCVVRAGACTSIAVLIAEYYATVLTDDESMVAACAVLTNSNMLQGPETTEIDHRAMKWLSRSPRFDAAVQESFRESLSFKHDHLAENLVAEMVKDARSVPYGTKYGPVWVFQIESAGAEKLLLDHLESVGQLLHQRLEEQAGSSALAVFLDPIAESTTLVGAVSESLNARLAQVLGAPAGHRPVRIARLITRKHLVCELQ